MQSCSLPHWIVGYFPLLKYFPVIGPYVPEARFIAILMIALMAFLIGSAPQTRRYPSVNELKSISAVKPKRESGSSRMKRKRGGQNVGWKRITANLDDIARVEGINPDFLKSPLARWVYFRHLTNTQGRAALHYALIMRRFYRYHTDTKSRTARAQGCAPGIGGEDQELERRASDGTMDQYLADARKAMRQYKKLHKVIAPFHGAKEMLDRLCVLDIEPPADHRASCAAVLTLVAKAFGIDEAYRRRA